MSYDNEKPASGGTDTGLENNGANEVSPNRNESEIIFRDTSDSVEFLRHYSPKGPWCLTTYSPQTRGVGCFPSNPENAAAFVQQWDGKQDVYFLLGIPEGKPVSLPKKEAMLGSAWLWVDLDPRAGEDLSEERQRILARLTSNLPKGIPAPTCVVDSGRGYWGL